MQASWKSDHRNTVIITNAGSYGQAFDQATDFVQAAGDQYYLSLVYAEGEENEAGRYEFSIKTY